MTSGIYAILNLSSGKRYVGKSVNVPKRWVKHQNLLRNATHHNAHLQHAWDLHGSDDFDLEVLEQVSDALVRSQREAYWCAHFKAHNDSFGYNLGEVRTDEGEVVLSDDLRAKRAAAGRKPMPQAGRERLSIAKTGTKASLATRRKMAASHSGKTRPAEVVAKIAAANRGQKRTAAQCAHNSEAHKGLPGTPHSEETKQRISSALRGQKRTPEQCARISAAAKNRVRKPHSAATKAKMSASRLAFLASKGQV